MPAISGSSPPSSAKLGEESGAPGPGKQGAVPLVEPFGLNAGSAGRRLTPLETHAEHLHRVRERLLLRRLVHGVPGSGRPEVGKTGAGNDEMRRIRMIDRRQHASLGKCLGYIDVGTQSMALDGLDKPFTAPDRFVGKVADRSHALYRPIASVIESDDLPLAVPLLDLTQPHDFTGASDPSLPVPKFAIHRMIVLVRESWQRARRPGMRPPTRKPRP